MIEIKDRADWEAEMKALGIRSLGEAVAPEVMITTPQINELISKAEQAHHIIVEELGKHSIEFKLAEAFIYPGIKTVGVKGDARVFEYPLFMAVYGKSGKVMRPDEEISYDCLSRISGRVTSEVKEIVRVVYKLTD